MSSPAPVSDTWQAVVSDQDGFVMTDREVRDWCGDPDAAELVNDSTPYEIAIVTRTAAPDDGKRCGAPRLPGSYNGDDQFCVFTVDYLEPDGVLRHWERAAAVAAAMNAASVP